MERKFDFCNLAFYRMVKKESQFVPHKLAFLFCGNAPSVILKKEWKKGEFIFTKLSVDLVPIWQAKFVDDVPCTSDIEFLKLFKHFTID